MAGNGTIAVGLTHTTAGAWALAWAIVVRAEGPFAGQVVVGVDGSAASAAALEFGIRFAERHHLPLAAVAVEPALSGELWVNDRMLETHLVHPSPALIDLDERLENLRHDFPSGLVDRVSADAARPATVHR